jgi:P27 family predicted phage terminase small subunit
MPPKSRAEREFEAHLVEPGFDPEPLPPPPPEHLSPAMRKWWTTVTHTYVLESHHLLLLETAADAWDKMVLARETVRREGLSVPTGNGGTKKNPAVDIERDARAQFITALRTLDLDVTLPPQDKHSWRPPPLRSNRR